LMIKYFCYRIYGDFLYKGVSTTVSALWTLSCQSSMTAEAFKNYIVDLFVEAKHVNMDHEDIQ